MGPADLIWMVILIGGALYILYRSLWKKRGYCHGCPSQTCHGKKRKNKGCSPS
ncbi:MAG: FeoB-associated Cys-rich membrane protein [Thermodesulfobacteriota bacterium]